MSPVRITVRVDSGQLKRAQKALGAKTTSETVQRALTLVTEKAVHDRVIRRYSGAGKPDAFAED
jgi:hypothetical protein